MQLLPAALSAMGGTAATTATVAASSTIPGLTATLAVPSAAAGAGMLGSMGTLLSTASTIGGIMSTMYGAKAQEYQGMITNEQMKLQATNEQIKAEEESIARRERLLDALSMQSAKTGAAGITSVGTPAHIQKVDTEKFEREQAMADLSTKMQTSATRAKGRSALTQAKHGAKMSLLDAGTRLASIG